MRVAALIVGVVGGLAGIAGAMFAILVGGIGGAVGVKDTGMLLFLGLAAVAFSIAGLVGAGLTLSRPKAAGVTLLVSALGGLVAVSWGYVVAFPALFVAGVLSLVAAHQANPPGP